MAHRRRNKAIPHTIERGGYYYLNLRSISHPIRLSLKTSSFEQAFQIVNGIISQLGCINRLREMDNSKLKKLVSRIRERIINASIALIDLDSEQAKTAKAEYNNYSEKLIYDHINFSSLTFETIASLNLSEPDKPLGLVDFKLENLHPKGVSPSELAAIETKKLFPSNYEQISIKPITQRHSEFEDAKERINGEFMFSREMREQLETSNLQSAKELLAKYEGSYRIEEGNNKVYKPFSDYADMYLNAGREGKLHPLREGGYRPKWSGTNDRNYTAYMGIFKTIFGDLPLNEVNRFLVDEQFSEVIYSLPLRNKSPYNKMSFEAIVSTVIDGSMDEQDIIANKTVLEYMKVIKGLYLYLNHMEIYPKNPVEHLKTDKKKDNKRGALTRKQALEIVEYCMKETNMNKRWPFILMVFTGARNAEVMQLRKSDVKKCPETNIDYIKIADDAGSVKTDAGNRRVPIHSTLKELGFLKFVEGITSERLFDQSARYLTRQYSSAIKTSCNIPSETEDGQKLNLYSLRHTFITNLQGKNVNLANLQQIVGHSKSHSVTGGYTHDIELVFLADSVEKFSLSI